MLHGVVSLQKDVGKDYVSHAASVESLDSEGNQADRHRAKEQDTHRTMNSSCLL